MPVVYLDAYASLYGPQAARVAPDDGAIVRAAMRELSAGRPAAYGFVGYYYATPWERARHQTFREQAGAAGKPFRVFRHVPADRADHGARSIRLAVWLAALPRHAAVMAVNDQIAVDVSVAARAAGLRIPQDMTLVGVDNKSVYPALSSISTVQVDYECAGWRSAALLERLMSGRAGPGAEEIVGPMMVVRRESTRGFGAGDRRARRSDGLLSHGDNRRARLDGRSRRARRLSRRRRLVHAAGDVLRGARLRPELARKRCSPNVGDPWLVGYFLDNELRWWGLGDSATGLFDLVRTLPPEHSARQALERFVAQVLQEAASAASFGGPGAQPPPTVKRAFVALVAERYFSTLCAAIRKADPDHLILGSRFAGMDFAPEILAACGRHCDVVSVNVYPWADLDTGIVLQKRGGIPLAAAFRDFHEKTGGKPLLLTEWSFPALDSGLPCTYGAGQRFHTQVERAQASEMLLRTVMSLPFLVGDDFFMWQDDPALGFNKHFHENSNYGLVNVNDEPYAELTEMFARVHAEAPLIRAGAANRANGGASPPGEPPTSSPRLSRWKTPALRRFESNTCSLGHLP